MTAIVILCDILLFEAIELQEINASNNKMLHMITIVDYE